MARKKKTSNLNPPEQSQPASSANSVKSSSSLVPHFGIRNWFGEKLRRKSSDKPNIETYSSQSQPSLGIAVKEPILTVPPLVPTRRAPSVDDVHFRVDPTPTPGIQHPTQPKDSSGLKDSTQSKKDLPPSVPVDSVLPLSSSSAENVCLGTSSKGGNLSTAPSSDVNPEPLRSSSVQIPQITLIPPVQINPGTVSKENIATIFGPSTSVLTLSIDALQSSANEEVKTDSHVQATAISNSSGDIEILSLDMSCSSPPASVTDHEILSAPEPPSDSSQTVSADHDFSKTLQLDKQAVDTKLADIWLTTLEKANLKLAEYKLPLLKADNYNRQAAGENIHFVLEDLKVAQEQHRNRRWQFTWNGKKVIVVERLEKILKSFQKYTGIVDTAIQHSPEVTALVWAGVRAMLQITLAHIEAIKSFEAAIAEVMGKLAMCELYAGIYVGVDLRSAGMSTSNIQKLQEAMAEALPDLYVAVIVFSVKARTYFEAKWLKKLAYMLNTFELEVQPFIDDINAKEKCIGDYADAITKERIKDMEGVLKNIKGELESISKLHELSNILQETHQVVLNLRDSAEDERINKLLEMLSPLAPLKRHQDIKAIRFANSGTWLLQLEAYNKWCALTSHEDKNYHILCCYGIPGAGKTFLSCIVIEDLKARFGHGFNIGIACIYSDYRDQANQTLNHILGTILHQLLATALETTPPEAITILQKIQKENRKPEKEELLSLLTIALGKLDLTFICIDALDEQDPKIRLQLLRAFAGLGTSTIRLFFTARNHVQGEIQTHLKIPPQCEIEITANPEDLQQYLKQQITEDADPEAMDEELCLEIVARIVGRANGMFLLPALHIQLVLDKPTKFERRLALETLPDDLYTTFGEVVQRIKGERRHAELGMKVFMWLHFARRPLKLQELQHALAVVDGQERFDPTNIPSKKALLDCCCGLVTVDEETITVRFVHFSLEEYFRKHNSEYFPQGCTQVAKSCLDYLNYEQITPNCTTYAELAPRLEEFPFLEYAASTWGYYVQQREDCEALQNCSFKLLNHDLKRPPCAIQILYQDESLISSVWRYRGYGNTGSGIHVAAYFGLLKMTTRLCETQGADLEDVAGRTPLALAAKNGHESVVRLLLERVDVDVNKGDEYGWTSLIHASNRGHESVVQLLLERVDVDVNKRSEYGWTPLIYASSDGHESVVRLLLERVDDVNKGDEDGWTPLIHASNRGHESVVQLLLERVDVDVNKRSKYGWTPLIYASSNRHESVVRLVLERVDVDVNKGDKYGRTPLIHASSDGHESVVRLLLERVDVDVNKGDKYGRTPLIHASRNGHESVVQLLLERNDIQITKTDLNKMLAECMGNRCHDLLLRFSNTQRSDL